MRVAAICDACHRPLMERTFALQVQGADLYVTSTGVHTRTPDHLRAYTFCVECMAVVRSAIEYVLSGQPEPVSAPPPTPPTPPVPVPQPVATAPQPQFTAVQPVPRRSYEGYDEVVREPGDERHTFDG
jgi:hypothetical protein